MIVYARAYLYRVRSCPRIGLPRWSTEDFGLAADRISPPADSLAPDRLDVKRPKSWSKGSKPSSPTWFATASTVILFSQGPSKRCEPLTLLLCACVTYYKLLAWFRYFATNRPLTCFIGVLAYLRNRIAISSELSLETDTYRSMGLPEMYIASVTHQRAVRHSRQAQTTRW